MAAHSLIDREHHTLYNKYSPLSRISRVKWLWNSFNLNLSMFLIVFVIIVCGKFVKDTKDMLHERQRSLLGNFTDREEAIIHVSTYCVGAEYVGRIEVLVKSILLFHGGIIHMHFFADARAQEVLSMMLQTWRTKRLRWSLYGYERAHDTVDFIPTAHRAGNMGYLKLLAHNFLPLNVEKVIHMDADSIILEDIYTMNNFFKNMEKQGAFFGASSDMYYRVGDRTKLPRLNLGPNVGVIMLDLKRMRQTANWNDLWREETLRLLREFGPPTASEQDTFSSLELFHPNWGYRVPCEYNYQLGEAAIDSLCLGNASYPQLHFPHFHTKRREYMKVKVPHWTEADKWGTAKPSTRHFTRIYRCIQMIDWSAIIGEDTDNDILRTLLYMKEGEKPNRDAITLSVSANFSDAISLIERVSEWPGAVELIIVGSDKERMQLRDFLQEHRTVIGSRISVHFVHHRTNLDIHKFARNLLKLSADISRTDIILLALDIDAIDISQRAYDLLGAVPNDRFTAVIAMTDVDIGLLSSKKNIQRFAAEGKSFEETSKLLGLPLSNFTSGKPSIHTPQITTMSMEYPSTEFCQKELSKRMSLVHFNN